ncbi:hypothetical protein EDB84DRAFT_163255 [Lactarius hengduanensis]|nr:hypothetical protein EDB84DRAFT_163255 [Lactarius hengduanensis]
MPRSTVSTKDAGPRIFSFSMRRRKRRPEGKKKSMHVGHSHTIAVVRFVRSVLQSRPREWTSMMTYGAPHVPADEPTREAQGTNGASTKQGPKLQLRFGNWRGRGPEFERLESELEFQLQMGVPSSPDAEQVSKDAPMLNELTEPLHLPNPAVLLSSFFPESRFRPCPYGPRSHVVAQPDCSRAERRRRQQPRQRVDPANRYPETQVHRPRSDNEPVRGGRCFSEHGPRVLRLRATFLRVGSFAVLVIHRSSA